MIQVLGVYLMNILYGLDILLNILIGGDRRETVSSRMGKGKRAGKPVHTAIAKVIDVIFWILNREENHCIDNIQDIDDVYSISHAIDVYVK